MTILKDFSFLQLIKNFSILIVIVSLSYAVALAVNSYIEYKFFNIPSEDIKPKKLTTETSKNYQYVDLLFEKISAPSTQIEKSTTNKSEPVVIPTAKPSQLNNIKLIGTVLSGKEKMALLKVNNEIKLVKKNQKIGNLKLKKIDRFTVVLTDGIKDYNISINIAPNKTSYRNYSRPISRKPVETPIKQEDNYYEISKREVEKYTADLGNLLKYVRIVPVVKNGETKGYKFLYVSPRSILYKYGLRSGDFIVSVNGMSVKTAEEAFKVYNMLRNEKTIRLEVERKGERKVITYQIK